MGTLNMICIKKNNLCRIKHVDVVKDLHFRNYMEALYNLRTNPKGKVSVKN